MPENQFMKTTTATVRQTAPAINGRFWPLLAAACLLAILPAQADITSGLVFHLPFDEGSGVIAADATGNGDGGSLTNFLNESESSTTGRVGGAPLPDTSDAGRGLDLSALILAPLYEADFQQPLRLVKEADLFTDGQRVALPNDAEWVLEGPASAETRDGRLHLVNEGGHLVCWNTRVFPADLLLEFDVVPADASQGLAIVFFAATGRDGGGIFDQDQPYRDGIFPTYHSGGLDSYHVSYWATSATGAGRDTANIRKNHGFHLVSQGLDFITGSGPGPHRVRILKLGGRIEVEVNGRLSVSWTDDGQTHGPGLQGGRIGLRQMVHTHACSYPHFKVWSVTAKPGPITP